MLQTSVRHSYSSPRSACSAVSDAAHERPVRELRQQALAEASEEGFAHDAVKLTHLLDLRYPHQGSCFSSMCEIADGDKARLKQAFDDVHLQVYGQSAPKEDAEIVTFRLQANRGPAPATIARGDGRAERALKGERPLFDIDGNRFVRAKVYDRQKLMAGETQGPRSSTSSMPRPGAGRQSQRRRHRHPDHQDRRAPMTSNPRTTVSRAEVVASRLRYTLPQRLLPILRKIEGRRPPDRLRRPHRHHQRRPAISFHKLSAGGAGGARALSAAD